MSVFEVPTYVTTVPLPAPVTTGGTQFYTDPNGDTWVAAPGVSSGAWKRANTALYCYCWRSAAYNMVASNSPIVMDTAAVDDYGLFASGGITCPIGGLWSAGAAMGYVSTAVGDPVSFYLGWGGTQNMRSSVVLAQAVGNNIRATASGMSRIVAGNQISLSNEYTIAGRGMTCSSDRFFLWAKYEGP